MPRNRKYFAHGTVLLISSRVEEGLPLVPNSVMNLILRGIVAKATEMYDVELCHIIFMDNHLHLILVVRNPEHVKDFVGYIKCESAHAVNRLLGRRQRTVWQDGYDSPVVLTREKVEHYIKYLYLNPIEENLESSIDLYPGVSSWEMFVNDTESSVHPRIRRSAIKPLACPALSIKQQRRIAEQLRDDATEQHTLVLKPWAWLESFDIPESAKGEIKERLVSEIRLRERELAVKRKQEGKGVVGATALRRQSMRREHTPEKFAPRMICLCEDKELRRSFIEHFRGLCEQAREVYQRWKMGDFSLKIPPGLYAPRVPLLVSALP